MIHRSCCSYSNFTESFLKGAINLILSCLLYVCRLLGCNSASEINGWQATALWIVMHNEFPSIVSQLSQLPELAMHSGSGASGNTSGKVSSMCCGYLLRHVPCCEVCRRARVRVCLCTSGEEVWAPHVSLTVSITLGLTKVYNGREWSLASRLWLKIALLLYMRFPIHLPIHFIYGVAGHGTPA